MQNSDDKKVDRRTFIQTAGVVAGSAIASTALSYDRILGANDRIALGIFARAFPGREVTGINCTELIWGLGALHCITQQQPEAIRDSR